MLLGSILAKEGFLIDAAHDGNAALKKLRSSPYDALILDLMIPGPNGFEIIQELKSRDRGLLGRTIVLTAAGQEMLAWFEDRRHIFGLLHKPGEIQDLVAELKTCVSSGPH